MVIVRRPISKTEARDADRLLCFLLRVTLSGGFLRVGDYIDPLLVGRGPGVVVIVPVPPFIRRGLGVTFWRIFPSFLTAERREVEEAPGSAHRFVAAVVDEGRAE